MNAIRFNRQITSDFMGTYPTNINLKAFSKTEILSEFYHLINQ